jgi:hypothetical protein
MLVAYTAKYDTVLIDSLPSVKCQEGSSKWSQVLKRHWTVQNAFIHAMNFQYINKFYTYRICYWAIRQMSMKLNLGKCSTHNLCIVDLCSETSKKRDNTTSCKNYLLGHNHTNSWLHYTIFNSSISDKQYHIILINLIIQL